MFQKNVNRNKNEKISTSMIVSRVAHSELPFNKDFVSSFQVNLVITTGALGVVIGTYLYVKKLKTAEIEADRKKELGKAKIGGPFNLIDHNGNPKSNKDYLGKWALIYFGFTHCPDVCPDEMEKLGEVYDNIRESRKTEKYVDDIVPLFITVDPDRDSVRIISTHVLIINSLYCKERTFASCACQVL